MTGLSSHLFVPLDGSELAEVALPVAAALARGRESRITLLHVIEAAPPATIHGERHIQTDEEAADYLAEVADRLRSDELSLETRILPRSGRSCSDDRH